MNVEDETVSLRASLNRSYRFDTEDEPQPVDYVTLMLVMLEKSVLNIFLPFSFCTSTTNSPRSIFISDGICCRRSDLHP